jgi:hypothetical protein
MKFRQYRLQNADPAASGGGSTTLMTDGAQTNAAASTPASTDTPAPSDANVDASQQAPADQSTTDQSQDATPPEKVVPEKYEFKQPEGVAMDAELLGEFEGIAKELKLSQEEAQKVTDIGAKLAQKWEAKQADVIQQAAAEWVTQATSDKEFGGEKLTESLAVAKKALNAFGTPELRALLDGSRLGNHPEVIRFMVRAGKAISEDRMVTGGTGPKANADTAKTLYPNQS